MTNRKNVTRIIFLLGTFLLLVSCASAPSPDSPQEATKYPRKPADDPERKSGPAMLFYEAAEEDADPARVIVIPPDNKKTKNDHEAGQQ